MEEKKDRSFILGVAAGVFFSLVFGASFYLGSQVGKQPQANSVATNPVTVDKLVYLEQLIDEEYLYEKDTGELSEGLYTGLIYGLGDPYAAYYMPEEYSSEMEYNAGSFVGIGITMYQDPEDQQVVIEAVMEDSPAEEAGLEAEDRILSVNGQDVTLMTSSEVVTAIRTSQGQAVLEVYRPSEEENLTITIEVREVEMKSVHSQMIDDTIGYLQIDEFTSSTPTQFSKAMESLRGEGMKKLVVDLRGNPGGMLDGVCDVLRQILPKGLILYTEDKWGRQETYSCDGQHPLGMPMAVLIDGQSASAAEIFAGAVKDYSMGTLVGTTTFGKGIVQSLIELPDGSAVKMTTAEYFTPKGNQIHGVGVAPDVEVEPGEDDDPEAFPEGDTQLRKAIQILQGTRAEKAA